MFFNRTGIETEDLEFNTRKLDLENDEEYKKLLVDYNQKMENLSKANWIIRSCWSLIFDRRLKWFTRK